MVFSLSATAFAADNNFYNVIRDNSEVRVAEEYIDGTKYVYTFDKSAQVLLTETFDSNNTIQSSKTVHLPDVPSVPSDYDESSQIQTFASSHYQHTFLNYEYDELSSNSYQLRKKDLYVTRYLPKDRDAIDNYVSAVDTLNAAELAVIASGGTAAVWAIATYITAGLTAGEIATTAGVALADVIALNLAIDNCESSWRLYVNP